jgi:predicted permease
MPTLLADLAFALRQLIKHRVYAITAIVSMALGIAATAAVYSVLHAVLIDPFPYQDANRIAVINLHDKQGDEGTVPLTLAEAQQMRKSSTVADVLAQRVESMTVTDGEIPLSAHVLEFTGNGFEFMKAPPLMGRTFTAKEAPDGAAPPPVAVISYLFWKTHFAGARDVIGKPLSLDHQKYTVIGVMGPRFTWVDSDVYLPIPAGTDPNTRYSTLLRLAPGATFAAAQGEMDSFVRQVGHNVPHLLPQGNFTVTVDKLSDSLLGQFKGTLFLLFASVGLLLLIGCGNVSILMLARGTSRQQELGMRTALGAPRTRLVRQLLTESVLVSVLGGLLGTAFAYLAIRLIVGLLPQYSIPHEVVISLNLPVLFFSAGISIATGILSGLYPAIQFSKPNLSSVLQAGDTRSTTSRGARARFAMIAGQVALTVFLLVGSGAAMKTFLEAYTAKLGFDAHNSILMFLELPKGPNANWQSRSQYLDALTEAVKTTPGVVDASVSNLGFPPEGMWVQPVNLIGAPADDGRRAGVMSIDADYFGVQRIPILQGRSLSRSEVLRGAHLAVVTETFAKRYLPNTNPIGHQIVPTEFEQASTHAAVSPNHPLIAPNPDQPYEIIGVVGDTRNDGLHRPILPQVYVPSTALIFPAFTLIVRTAGDPHLASNAIGESLSKFDDTQSILQQYVYEDFLSTFVWSHERFISILFAVFAIVALSLAAIGLFSVVAYSVEQRTREIGIRMALGAPRHNVLLLTVRSMIWTTAVGLLIGIGLSISLSDTVHKWTQSSMRDPGVLSLVSAIFIFASIFACLLPARRATRVDPMIALRSN